MVKKIKGGMAHEELAIREFIREREVLSRLSHPHIVGLLACGEDTSSDENKKDNPELFLVFERLDGGSLRRELAKKRAYYARPFEYGHFLELSRQLADALCFLHLDFSPHAIIIHRGNLRTRGIICHPFTLTILCMHVYLLILLSDLKPDNICFTNDGQLKLIDFGLCICVKRTREQGLGEQQPYKMTGTLTSELCSQ
jgi:serine/threonine protein kinase